MGPAAAFAQPPSPHDAAPVRCGSGCRPDQEHRGGSGDGQEFHQFRRQPKQEIAHGMFDVRPGRLRRVPDHVQPDIVKLDDAGDQAVNTYRHQHGDCR